MVEKSSPCRSGVASYSSSRQRSVPVPSVVAMPWILWTPVSLPHMGDLHTVFPRFADQNCVNVVTGLYRVAVTPPQGERGVTGEHNLGRAGRHRVAVRRPERTGAEGNA